MKILLTLAFMIGMIHISYSQQQIKKVRENVYEMIHEFENNTQIGFFKLKSNGDFIRHGEWKLLKGNKVITTVYYENDMMMWIKPISGIRYTKEQLEIERLKMKVNKLEKELALN